MRKPKPPNTLGFYGLKQNAHGAKSLATRHTVNVHQQVSTVHPAKHREGGGNPHKQPSLKGFIYQNKHMRLGFCLMLERTVQYV